MKTICHITLSLFFILSACNSKQAQPEQQNTEEDSIISQLQKIAEIEEGEIFYKNKDPFGEIIELKGNQIIADTVIFSIGGAEMIIKDNIMTLKTGQSLMLFNLPEMTFLGYKGKFGQGPDELNYPHLIPTTDSESLCYLFEATNQKLYRLDKNGEILLYPFSFTKSRQKFFSDKAIVNIAPDDFMYAETSSTGKSIFRTINIGDSVVTNEVYNLGLNPKRKAWTAYMGDFAVNPQQNRMVYAYKYFKIIKFMDMDAKKIRTINFEKEEYDHSSAYRIDGMDENVTHYWGVCAQDNYVYFLYSGRTPSEVYKENSRKNSYIYVEQYDWNGNPIHKFKLDQWGYFTVDEKNKKIYLGSTNHDDPFFVYDLPASPVAK